MQGVNPHRSRDGAFMASRKGLPRIPALMSIALFFFALGSVCSVTLVHLLLDRSNAKQSSSLNNGDSDPSNRDSDFSGFNSQFKINSSICPPPPQEKPPVAKTIDFSPLSLTIFTYPKPYAGHSSDPQRLAILSWLKLQPTPEIVLLGNHPSFFAIASEFAPHVTVEKGIDSNFRGIPLLHSVIARAQVAKTDLIMLIGADTIILSGFSTALTKAYTSFDHFVLAGLRWSVLSLPEGTDLEEKNENSNYTQVLVKEKKIRKLVQRKGKLLSSTGVDLWLWNAPSLPLFSYSIVPPFALGRGKHDKWMMQKLITEGLRQVIDVTETVTAVRMLRGPAESADAARPNLKIGPLPPLKVWQTAKTKTWEVAVNSYLALQDQSFDPQKGSSLHAPFRLVECQEPLMGNACLVKQVRAGNCSCIHSANSRRTQTDNVQVGDHFTCGDIVESKLSPLIAAAPKEGAEEGMPHTLEQILPQLAGKNKIITLVAISIGYVDMLMNFVCRLRRLGLPPVLVAAMDEKAYEFAYLQGLAVYFEQYEGLKKVNQSDCTFATLCFAALTKMKSRAVLHVIKMGYNVLWTDVDIVWFRDPLPELLAFGPGVLPIQSDHFNQSIDPTAFRVGGALNSGFYYARSEPKVIEAFEAIVTDAATGKVWISEQTSFYNVLCGNGSLVTGPDTCTYKNGLVVKALDRDLHPNGLYKYRWFDKNVTSVCLRTGAATLHNNWIPGHDKKVERLVKNNFWHYEIRSRMCRYEWHPRNLAKDTGALLNDKYMN